MGVVGVPMLSAVAADHVNSPRNFGQLDGATHVGHFGRRGEGPYMVLYFQVASGKIEQATYETNGCPSSIACASATVQLLAGRTVEKALLLSPSDLILILGGLPEGKGECADMAVSAVQNAFEGE